MHRSIMERKSAHSNVLVDRKSRRKCIHTIKKSKKQLTHHKVTVYDKITSIPMVVTGRVLFFKSMVQVHQISIAIIEMLFENKSI